MKIGIIGLPLSGKSTVFNVLSGAHVEVKTHPGGAAQWHLGTIKVPDQRLDKLASIYNPKKVTHTEITFIDSAAVVKEHPKKILDVSHIKEVDGLLHVVRLFEDPLIPHPQGSIDSLRDIALVELELIISDDEAVTHRLEKIEKEIKRGVKEAKMEQELLLRCKKTLEYETPLRGLEFTREEEKLVRGFQFLSQKPMMIVANIAESEMGKPLPEGLQKLAQAPYRIGTGKISVMSFCAKVEMDIEEMSPQEQTEYFAMEGITEPARERFVKEAYAMLDAITFYTGNENELKAWTAKAGTHAVEAAGKIHTDMERGFIRAEVIGADDLILCGSFKVAKEKGLLRLEGKDYVVGNYDVINFRFSV